MILYHNNDVWYLMLLHHSQTDGLLQTPNSLSGILCFCIILKLWEGSFWWKMMSGILCFYIILKLRPEYGREADASGILCFYIILKLVKISLNSELVWYLMLLHHSQTHCCLHQHWGFVWYLMLLHHSQTRCGRIPAASLSGILCFYIILKHTKKSPRKGALSGILCFYIILKREEEGRF